MRYAVRRISPMGALLYGLLLGLAVWLIPGALLGWLVRATVLSLRDWLGGLQLTIPLPFGEGIALDLGTVLPLGDSQARLAALAGQDTALMLAVAVGTAAAGMLLTGLTAFLGSILYNLFAGIFDGIEVRLDALDAPARRPVVNEPAAVGQRPFAVVAATSPTATSAPPPVVSRPRPDGAKAPQTAPVAWLIANGDGRERRALRDDVTRIGSAPENDIVLAGLAPQHAEIRRESGRYLIYDLGSRRTWVNDVQVAAVQMLKDGFRLQLGQSEFLVQIMPS